MPTTPITVGCLCGAVRYSVDGPVDHVDHCHCTMCRRATGGLTGTFVNVAQADLTWTQGLPTLPGWK